MSSHVLSRSEKKALDDLELRNWMKQENETHWMNIDLIYHEVILQWYFNPENRNNKKIYEYPKCDISIYMRSTLTNQPRWKPTFKDIEDGLSNHLREKLLDIMNFQNSFEIEGHPLNVFKMHFAKSFRSSSEFRLGFKFPKTL